MPPSDEFRAALRAGQLEEAFLLAMGRATELEVTTWVVPAGSGRATPAQLAPRPGQRLRTRIDLLQGDIENEVGDRFLRERSYQELRQFHREQVGRGSEIIAQNIESLRRLFDVMRALHSSAAIAPPDELAPQLDLPLPSSTDWATQPDSNPTPAIRPAASEGSAAREDSPAEIADPGVTEPSSPAAADADSIPAEWAAWASQDLEGEPAAVSWGEAQATAWLDEWGAPSEVQPDLDSPPPPALPEPWARPAAEPRWETSALLPEEPQAVTSDLDERAAAPPDPEAPLETTLDDLFRDLAGDSPEPADPVELESDPGGDEQAWDDFVAFVEADSLEPLRDAAPQHYPELAENADWGEWFADDGATEPAQSSASAAGEPPAAPFPKAREEDWETFTPEPFEPEASPALEPDPSETAEGDFFRANFLIDEPLRDRGAPPPEHRPNPS